MAGEFWIGNEGVAELIDYFRTGGELVSAEQENTFGLTPRELDIIAEILAGSTNKDIAAKLSISPETVKRHLSNIYDKLGVSNRLELALYASTQLRRN
jgi:two-component system, NarL family, nitrate/nitrite response regulator NarL